MARVRPRTGGLLSIACVPMGDAYEASFRGLAATADLVLLCPEAGSEVLERWEGAAEGTPVVRLSGQIDATCLLDGLERFSSSLDQMGAGSR